jgi:hypothetical protein
VDDNYDPNILKWVDTNCPRTFVYDDAQVTVLEEALPFQTNKRSRIFLKNKKNPDCKSYNYKDSTRLVQTLFRICAFCRVIKHIITKCP